MNKVCIFFISMILLTIVNIPTCTKAAESSTDNFWQYNLGIPTSDFDYKAVAVNDKIYIFYFDKAVMYDPVTGRYSDRATNPVERTDYAIAAVGNTVYVIGGRYFASTQTSLNQAYNTQINTWETKQSIPQPNDYITANAIGNKIYVIGAENSPVQVYDTSTNSWETKNPPPYNLQRFISCPIENKIYVINSGNMYIYDTEKDSWSSGAKALKNLANSGIGEGVTDPCIAGTIGNYAPKRVYVMGGSEGTTWDFHVIDYNHVYDVASDSWSLGSKMLSPRIGFAVAVVKDQIYTLGGNSVNGYDGEVMVYTPIGYSSMPLVTSAPTGGSGGLSALAVVVGVAIAGVVLAVTAIAVIHFRHTPVKTAKPS
jgi:hypothetical protein